jgi:hypothetical protein
MSSRRPFLAAVVACALVPLSYVARLVSRHSIDVVQSRHLLPRWDLAAHLVSGWTDYYLLKTLQLHRLAADIWQQGYWPPVHSLFQVPFHLLLGGGLVAGLQSSLAAFVLIGLAAGALLCTEWDWAGLLPSSLFLLFLLTSPFYLAFASVAMMEMLGALVELLVLLSYLRYEQHRSRSAARLFAISLTILFFTKYNYFVLLAVPLILHEFLRRTPGATATQRAAVLYGWARARLSTVTGALLAIYLVGVLLITLSGGFEFVLLGRRVSLHTIGNTGYPVLYGLLARVWFLQRRGRIDWQQLFALDPRIRPLLVWFVVPVIVWLASPYPNHMKDVANLVINAPMGQPSMRAGATAYLLALRDLYFAHVWLLALAVGGLVSAVVRYRKQPVLMQWLILAALLQFAMIAVHQTRFPRFLMQPVLLFWLASAAEIGSWFRGRGVLAAGAAGIVAAASLIFAVADAPAIVASESFQRIALEHYTDSPALNTAFETIRSGLSPTDRIAVLGRSNELSPGLFDWELGPPSGAPAFPVSIVGGGDDVIDHATRVVLIVPTSSELTSAEITEAYAGHASALQKRLDRGELALDRDLPVDTLHVTLRVYRRVRVSGDRPR